MALAVLSGSTVSDTRRAIAAGDVKRFQVVPGIGRKTAERVIVELRERIAGELAAGAGGRLRRRGRPRARARGAGGPWLRPRGGGVRCSRQPRLPPPMTPQPEDLIAAALRTAVKAA